MYTVLSMVRVNFVFSVYEIIVLCQHFTKHRINMNIKERRVMPVVIIVEAFAFVGVSAE